MFDDFVPEKKPEGFPRNLETLSIDELTAYLDALHHEIERVEREITAKKQHQEAASQLFSS